jgi:hypothetical protein
VKISARLKTKLAPFKVPKEYHVVEAFPKSAAGKILKREIRKEYLEGFRPRLEHFLDGSGCRRKVRLAAINACGRGWNINSKTIKERANDEKDNGIGGLMIAAFGIMTLLPPAQVGAETIELKFAQPFSPKHTMQKKVFEPWAEKISKMTNGKVKVTFFPGGALGKTPDHYGLAEKGHCRHHLCSA